MIYGAKHRTIIMPASVKLILDHLRQSFERYTYLYTLAGMLAYLLIFQTHFVMTGDTWAEAFYEYVHGAIANGWQGFFFTGIAGYFNFLPKLLTYSYVSFGLPLQYIDHMFRFSVIAYALLCISFISHSYNRSMIKNDYMRTLFAFMVLLTYYHISSFSIINIWYVGFIPITLVSLSSVKFRNQLQELAYAAFAMSVCLTKPSLILFPLVIYRAIRHKEYLLGSIIAFSITLQSLLFFTSSYYHTSTVEQHVHILVRIVNVLLYLGVLLLKLFRLSISSFWLIPLASLFIFGLIAIAIRIRGFMQAALITLTLLLASYTAIYAPDAYPVSVRLSYDALFHDEMKLQREVMISFLLLLLIFITANYAIKYFQVRSRKFGKLPILIVIVPLLFLVGCEYRTIDTRSSNLYINIDAFRPDLRTNRPVCMPIPPTPSWTPYGSASGPTYGWYYENGAYGSCSKLNYNKTMDKDSFTHKIGSGLDIDVEAVLSKRLSSVLIPISNPYPGQTRHIILENTASHKTYTAVIENKTNSDKITYLAFDLTDESPAPIYRLVLKEAGTNTSNLTTGTFKEGGVIIFPYFLSP